MKHLLLLSMSLLCLKSFALDDEKEDADTPCQIENEQNTNCGINSEKYSVGDIQVTIGPIDLKNCPVNFLNNATIIGNVKIVFNKDKED